MLGKIFAISALTATNIAALPTAASIARQNLFEQGIDVNALNREEKVTQAMNNFNAYIREAVVYNSPLSYGITDEMDYQLRSMAVNNEVWKWIGTPIFEQIEIQLQTSNYSSLEQSNYLYSIKSLFEEYYPGLTIDLESVSLFDTSRTYADAYNTAVRTGLGRSAQYPTNFRVTENELCNGNSGFVFDSNTIYPSQYDSIDALPGSGWAHDPNSISGMIKIPENKGQSMNDVCQRNILDGIWNGSNSNWEVGSNFTIYNGYTGYEDRVIQNNYDLYDVSDSSKKVETRELRYLHRGIDDQTYRNQSKVIMVMDYFGYHNQLETQLDDLGFQNVEHILVYNNINNLTADFMALNSFTGERLDTDSGANLGDDYVNMAHNETLNKLNVSEDLLPTIITPAGSEWYYRNLLDGNQAEFSTVDGKTANMVEYQLNSELQYEGSSYSSLVHTKDDYGLPAMQVQRYSNTINNNPNILNNIFDTMVNNEYMSSAFQTLQHELSIINETESIINSSQNELDIIEELFEQGLLVMVVYEQDMYWTRTQFYQEQINAMNHSLDQMFPGNQDREKPIEFKLHIATSAEFQDYNLGLKRDEGIGGLMHFEGDIANRKISISSYEQETVLTHRNNIDDFPGISSINDHEVALTYTSGLLNTALDQKGLLSDFVEFNSIADPSLNELKYWAATNGIFIYDSTEEVLASINSDTHDLALINNTSVYGGVLLHQYANVLKVGSFESSEYFFPISFGMTETRTDVRDITYADRPLDICQSPDPDIPGSTQKDDDYILSGDQYEIRVNITCDDLRSTNPWFVDADAQDIAFSESDSELIYGVMSKLLISSDTSLRHRHHASFTDIYEELISSKLLAQYRIVGVSMILGFILLLTYRPIFNSIVTSERNVHLANVDQLTGLFNRRYLNERADHWENNPDDSLTVCYIDFDKFKKVNDFYGHDAGDELLKIFASKIKSYVNKDSEAYRVGGDEFIMIIKDTPRAEVEKIMGSLRKDISRQIIFASYSIIPSVSIGICYKKMSSLPKLADSITSADFALYEAKDKTELAWYSEESHFVLTYVNNIIKNGLSQEILRPNFQPIVNRKKKVIGFETLFRSDNKNINMNIGKIIAQLEKSNSTDIVDIAMTEKVANMMTTEWKEDIMNSDIWISVNISPKTLAKQMFFLEEAAEVLRKANVPVSKMTIEILEFDSEDDQLINQLKFIKKLGFHIAIDDFTAGSSSLSRIVNLKGLIDHIKIDQNVIQNSNAEIVKNTINFTKVLADSIKCESVIVEGVETKNKVVGDETTYYQGYYFSKPLPPKVAIKVLREGKLTNENTKIS